MPVSLDALTTALRGRYQVERLLGSGGMADVFLASDPRHSRRVAIKVLRPETAAALGAERFPREIAIVARLAHPHIVPLYDSGAEDGIAWFVMPYIEGQSLHDRLRQTGPLPRAQAVRIAIEAADALAYAHSQSIVHRDIKPHNLLLEADHVVIADFGVARVIEGTTGSRSATTLPAIGTPAYMSPEQLAGSDRVDGRSDLFSLALVFHEMLCGGLPLRTVTTDGVHMVMRFVADREKDGTRPFHAFLRRALATDPADRYQTAEEFTVALRAAAEAAGRRRFALAWVSVGVGVAAIAFVVTPSARGNAPHLSARRIVVAPLVNRTGDPSLAHIGEIASDWLASGLQRAGIVEVVPSETAIEARRRQQADSTGAGRDPIRDLAEETGAGLVVSGAYYKRGEQLVVRVQVSDAARGAVLETSEDESTAMADPLVGIAAVGQRLMGWLAIHYDERLKGSDGLTQRPPDYAAYRMFASGMDHYVSNRNAAAAADFRAAWRTDTSFTLALLYASLALTNRGDYATADSLLRRMQRDRDRLSEYHRAWLDSRLAMVAGDNAASLRAIRRAAELAPVSKAMYNLAVAAFQTGAVDEASGSLTTLSVDQGPVRGFFAYWDLLGAIEHARGEYRAELRSSAEARRRHPERLAVEFLRVRALAATGDVRALTDAIESARRLAPDPIGWTLSDVVLEGVIEELIAHGHGAQAEPFFSIATSGYRAEGDTSSRARVGLLRLAYAKRDWSEAERMLSGSGSAAAGVDAIGLRGLVAAHRGDSAAALAASTRLAKTAVPYGFGIVPLYRARIAAVLGDVGGAVALLDRAFAEGKEFDLWLHRDPDLKALHGSVAYETMMRRRFGSSDRPVR